MRKKVLKRIALLVAPIIWRRIRGKRGHHRRRGYHGRHHWYRTPHHRGRKNRRIWI